MTDSTKRNYVPLLISIGLLTYFIWLTMVNYFHWDFVLIGVFVELLTIPALGVLGGLFGYSIYRSFLGEVTQRPVYRMVFGVLLSCVLLLVWATFYF